MEYTLPLRIPALAKKPFKLWWVARMAHEAEYEITGHLEADVAEPEKKQHTTRKVQAMRLLKSALAPNIITLLGDTALDKTLADLSKCI